jgi:multidrug efflux pump subunit AcrB
MNDEFGDTFITIYALTGDGFDLAALRREADRIGRELRQLPDVKKIELFGVQDEKIYIEVSHAKLATLGLNPLAHPRRAAEAECDEPGRLLRDAVRPCPDSRLG